MIDGGCEEEEEEAEYKGHRLFKMSTMQPCLIFLFSTFWGMFGSDGRDRSYSPSLFFFAHRFQYISSFSFSFSLTGRNSVPGSPLSAPPPPLPFPTTVRTFVYTARKTQLFIPSPTRIELRCCWMSRNTRQQQWPLINDSARFASHPVLVAINPDSAAIPQPVYFYGKCITTAVDA